MSFKNTFLFKGMKQEFIDRVSGALEEETFEEGSFIFRQGDLATSLYFLTSGRVRVTVGAHGSVTKILSRPGEAFGWSSLVGRGTYTASTKCLSETGVKRISAEKMSQLLEEDPAEGLVFYRRLARFIRERLIDSYRILLTYDAEKKPHSYG
jgi:CRP-like cAMP-binding protein